MVELEQIGKFKVIDKLGQGSFGVVYKGRDPNIRRDVAIKVCSVADAGLRKRFSREAQISGNLQHKNIVTVFAADMDDEGVPYLVQEFLDGEDLRDVIRRRQAIPSYKKIDYLLQVARGLAHAHAHGVIHRDIKPSNVRVLADDRVKIMDFGIAKLASAETQLTQKGVTMGTASYLPPEQVRGGDLDHRADIFSFGVLAYEFLTYERPFRGNTLSALVYQILYKVPAPMSSVWPECPEVLAEVVTRCLEKKPDSRFASMEELIPRLEQIAREIEAGKWPALRGVSTVQAFLTDTPDDTGVMSQTEIARTARAVAEGEVATTRPMAPAVAGEARPGSAAVDSAKTEILSSIPSPPPLPEPAAPKAPSGGASPPASPPDSGGTDPDAPTVMIPQQELAERAHQIGDLIARGDLESAKARLEETMTEHQDGTGPPESFSAPPPPAATGPSTTSTVETAPPIPAPLPAPPAAPSTVARAADRPLGEAGSAVSWAQGPSAQDTLTGTLREPDPAAGPEPPAREEPTGSSAYMTAIFRLLPWQRWAALAALVLVLAVVGVMLLGPGGGAGTDADTDADPTLQQGTKPIEPEVPVPAPPGTVAVAATPWALVTEVTDSSGYVKEIPADPYTPLRLELAPGSYRIQLEYGPEGQESQLASCDVEVVESEVVACQAGFRVPAVTAYFKESGWWP